LSSTSSGRRELLSSAQRAQLLSLPISLAELEKFYTLTPADLDFIAGHRTDSNRLGIAVQLCFLRYPGRAWTPEENLPASMLRWIAEQVGADSCALQRYAERDQTRREHFIELLNEYGWRSFGLHEYRELSAWLMTQARSTDQGMALVALLIGELRHRHIVVPVLRSWNG
jgi:TnpA family transposase